MHELLICNTSKQ